MLNYFEKVDIYKVWLWHSHSCMESHNFWGFFFQKFPGMMKNLSFSKLLNLNFLGLILNDRTAQILRLSVRELVERFVTVFVYALNTYINNELCHRFTVLESWTIDVVRIGKYSLQTSCAIINPYSLNFEVCRLSLQKYDRVFIK